MYPATMRSSALCQMLSFAAVLALSVATPPDQAAAQPGDKKALAKSAPRTVTPPAPDPPPPPPDPANQMKTSDQVKSESVQGAVSAPLRDLNVVKTDIPDVLMAALADPYARPPAKATCRQLIALIIPLEETLGPDLDRASPDDPLMADKGRSTALGLGADLASGVIPFRGVVRRVTGAAAHDRLVQAAIVAGSVRRAYLKGLGEARGCGPPATPTHERTGAVQAVAEPSDVKPHYPTRPETAAPQTRAGTTPAASPKSRP